MRWKASPGAKGEAGRPMSDPHPPGESPRTTARREPRPNSRAPRRALDVPFFVILGGLGGSYILLIVALLAADIAFTSPRHFIERCGSRRFSSPSD